MLPHTIPHIALSSETREENRHFIQRVVESQIPDARHYFTRKSLVGTSSPEVVEMSLAQYFSFEERASAAHAELYVGSKRPNLIELMASCKVCDVGSNVNGQAEMTAATASGAKTSPLEPTMKVSFHYECPLSDLSSIIVSELFKQVYSHPLSNGKTHQYWQEKEI